MNRQSPMLNVRRQYKKSGATVTLPAEQSFQLSKIDGGAEVLEVHHCRIDLKTGRAFAVGLAPPQWGMKPLVTQRLLDKTSTADPADKLFYLYISIYYVSLCFPNPSRSAVTGWWKCPINSGGDQ